MHYAPPGHDTRDHDEIDGRVWNDLRQRIPRAQVHEVTARIYARYDDARIRVFIPVIVRREARGVLEQSLKPGPEVSSIRARAKQQHQPPAIVQSVFSEHLARYFRLPWLARSQVNAFEVVS